MYSQYLILNFMFSHTFSIRKLICQQEHLWLGLLVDVGKVVLNMPLVSSSV